MLREITILGTVALATGACGAESSDDERAAGVYAAVIRAVADAGPGDFSPDDGYDDRVVYAGPLDADVEIPLEVQATVIDQLHADDFATIRFVDDLEEAVRPGKTDEPVLEDGVLVLVSEVPADDDAPTVRAHRYVDVDTVSDFTAHASEADDDWEVDRLEPVTP